MRIAGIENSLNFHNHPTILKDAKPLIILMMSDGLQLVVDYRQQNLISY